MSKTKQSQPLWVNNLRTLMKSHELNPRSLSLKAGLNQTAVRDMLEGRVKFPRYDTAHALANALGVTTAELMGSDVENKQNIVEIKDFSENLDLLTEILIRLQEVSSNHRHPLLPNEYAAMAATIFKQMQAEKPNKQQYSKITPQIYNLIEYESLRRRTAR